jgi:hypothetical protein
MSGGSFDYLCYKDGAEAVMSSALTDMIAELYREFPDSSAANDTAALLALRDAINRKVSALQDVWKAVEWWRSCDWSRERAVEAVAEYERRKAVGFHPTVTSTT